MASPPRKFRVRAPSSAVEVEPLALVSEKPANVLVMNTLSDIIALGDRAAAAGQPLVEHWAPTRGCLQLLGHSCGRLDQVAVRDFDTRFPEKFSQLPTETQDRFPDASAYEKARRAVSRLLAMLGYIDDPWEALRLLIRDAGRREDIEYHWGGLKTPASEAGLAPADIRPEWVWSLDAEVSGGHRRHSLRRAVVMFDKLFDIEPIASSGLLPPEPIGTPPSYDNLGRRHADLPPRLAAYDNGQTGMRQIWQAICAAGGFDLPEDPGADDLLARQTWIQIERLPDSLTGVTASTWAVYLQRLRSLLLPHATRPVQEHLPERFEVMIGDKSDRWALHALWRQIHLEQPERLDTGIGELLELSTWRVLWRHRPGNLSARSFRQYEIRSRKILLRHAPEQMDPRRRVTRAWADAPRELKEALSSVRKAAEKALLRPQDITPAWLDGNCPAGMDRGVLLEALNNLNERMAVARAEAMARHPTPVAQAWQSLRDAARLRGVKTSRLGIVITPAVNGNLLPKEIDRVWATQISRNLTHRQNATFRMGIRALDEMRENPELARYLPTCPIGPLADRRAQGSLELPCEIARDLEALHKILGSAASTRREGRAVLRKLYTAAHEQQMARGTLQDLLEGASHLSDDARVQRKSQRLLDHLGQAQRDAHRGGAG